MELRDSPSEWADWKFPGSGTTAWTEDFSEHIEIIFFLWKDSIEFSTWYRWKKNCSGNYNSRIVFHKTVHLLRFGYHVTIWTSNSLMHLTSPIIEAFTRSGHKKLLLYWVTLCQLRHVFFHSSPQSTSHHPVFTTSSSGNSTKVGMKGRGFYFGLELLEAVISWLQLG